MNAQPLRIGFTVCLLAAVPGTVSSSPRGSDPCTDLNGFLVSPTSIGLPSGPATVDSAQSINGLVPGGHCRAIGTIAPIDPTAQPITFQINLPNSWNGKALQYGGGGFNGTLVTGENPLRDAPPTVATPLAQGYVTYGTDSGHRAAGLTEVQAFALNEEALTNFAYASYKKTRDVAVALISARYGRRPTRVYYFGGSEGGREALMMAQRFPADFDGVVSAVPVISWTAWQIAGIRSGQLQRDGGWLNQEKVKLLRNAVVEACDDLDGLRDGVISHYEGCSRSFRAEGLTCPNGTDSGDSCLSASQVAAVNALHAPVQLTIGLANGVSAYPGWGYGGEDQTGGMIQWVTGSTPATFPSPAGSGQGVRWSFGSGMVRYFVAQDSAYDPFTFSPDEFATRLRQVSALMDATNADLWAFFARGGKIILKENMADYAQSPYAGIEYYKAVVAHMGQPAADQFFRLYVTPGANHGGIGVSGTTNAPIPQYVDLLALLDGWVDGGEAPPDPPIQTTRASTAPYDIEASRPMCAYPAFPRYDSGDPNNASSFSCVVPTNPR